jgi:hypothetical protein
LFFSKKNNILLIEIIEKIIKNSFNRFYGKSPWDPTGPVLFGSVLNKENNDFLLGGCEKLNGESRMSYFLDKKNPIAYYKNPKNYKIFKSPETNYVVLWESNNFYL